MAARYIFEFSLIIVMSAANIYNQAVMDSLLPVRRPKPMPIKRSYGIMLCSYNRPARRVEVLVVRRRTTYDFYDFIARPTNNHARLIGMLNNMTCDEKLELLTLDFARIYYRLYGVDAAALSAEHLSKFCILRDLFNKRFRRDSGRYLRCLVQASNNVDSIWVVPKGHRELHEARLNCAIREFEEETGINQSSYTVLTLNPQMVYHVSNGIRYESYYYPAMLDEPRLRDQIRVNYSNPAQLLEVIDIRWMALVDTIGMPRLYRTLAQLLKYLRELVRPARYSASTPPLV